MTEPRPTEDSVLCEKSDWEVYYGTMHSNMSACERAYEGNIKCVVEKGYEKYVPPTASALVDTDVDHIITRNPIITCPPSRESGKREETADKLERFGTSVLSYNTINAPMPPAKAAAKDAAIYGMFCFKGPIYTPVDRKTKYYGQRFPIIFKTINPMTIFPSPEFFWHGDGPVIEIKTKTVGEIKQLWPDAKWTPGKDRKDNDDIELIERWSRDWKVYMADGLIVECVPNLYSYIPYEIGFSGLGRMGLKPENLSIGLLWRVLQSLEIEARTVSAIDAIVMHHAYPRLSSDVPPESFVPYWGTGPGGVDYVPKDANLRLKYEMHVPPFVYDHLGNIRASIHDATYSKVAQGENPVGVSSGYHQRVLMSEVRLKFGDVKDNVQYKLNKMLGKSAALVENVIREPVTIWGMMKGSRYDETIEPKEIDGHYVFEIDLTESSPEEAERRIMTGSELLAKGHISFEDFLTNFRREPNVTGYMRRMLVESVLQDQAIKHALAMGAAQKWGLDEYIPEFKARQDALLQQQAQGMAFGGGGPQIPPGMAPGGITGMAQSPMPAMPQGMDLAMQEQMMPQGPVPVDSLPAGA